MHLKKTKKTPRMFRMIALMLSLVLVFFTMTGMALAEEGTDVSDAAPDSTLEIVETELEVEPEPTEEPPAETPGAEETPEPTPESEEPSTPPDQWRGAFHPPALPRKRLRWNQIMSWTRKSRLAGTMRRLRSPFA